MQVMVQYVYVAMAEVWAWLLSVVQHCLSCWAVVFGPDQLSFLEMIN